MTFIPLHYIIEEDDLDPENPEKIIGFKCTECGSTDISRFFHRKKRRYIPLCSTCKSKSLTKLCPDCGSDQFEWDSKRAELVCKGKNCGLVLIHPPHSVGGGRVLQAPWGNVRDMMDIHSDGVR